jgi:hypothetical protein
MLYQTQRAFRDFKRKLGAPGSPVRHLRRAAYRALHPGRVREREDHGRKLTAALTPELAKIVQELRETGTANFNAHLDPSMLAELDAHYQQHIAPRAPEAAGSDHHRFFFELTRKEDNVTDNILVGLPRDGALLPVHEGARIPWHPAGQVGSLAALASRLRGFSRRLALGLSHRCARDGKRALHLPPREGVGSREEQLFPEADHGQ